MTFDAATVVPVPRNEPIHSYLPGSPETASIKAELARQAGAAPVELTMWIGDERAPGSGEEINVVMPHDHHHVLGVIHSATAKEAERAIDAALAAAPAWRALSFDDRAAIMLKAADLLTGPWRDRMNAATMLGQSKTIYQSEIDAVGELADFLRFNVAFARQLMAGQPESAPGSWNRMDYRPLEGFIYAITPFNFTSIAGNLPLAPALMGNVVIWKPSTTQQLAAHCFVEILIEAGLPAGVVNMLAGHGRALSDVLLAHPAFAGIHFTGSTPTFQSLWKTVGENIGHYKSYPRLVGETGGKDFIVAHPSADVDGLRVAMTRGAFEYQGQKCSAASRAYIPASIWKRLKDDLAAEVDGIAMGDVTDFSNFMGAVIDARAFAKHKAVLERAASDSALSVVAGGSCDDSTGYFVRPTVLATTDPRHDVMMTEFFGPILGVYVFDDSDYDKVLAQAADSAEYALTGAIFARDRAAIAHAADVLRFSAGNFYINDKPTGAVVGQQPFGGGRASGTNDKAGSMLNLLRWTSPRAVKELFVAPTDYRYPFMG